MTLAFFRDSDETLLAESVRKSFAACLSGRMPDDETLAPDVVRTVGEQGLVMPVTGGETGMTLVQAAIVLEEAGRVQLPFPLMESILAATAFDAEGGAPPDVLLSGQATASVITLDETSPAWPDFEETAIAAQTARWLVGVLSETAGGGSTILLENPADRLDIDAAPAFDLTVPLCRVSGDLEAPGNRRIGNDLRSIAYVLAAADLLGAASALFDTSVAYMRDREQFGHPIGSYQALRHRAADDWVRLEDIRAAVEYAAALYDTGLHDAEADRDTVLEAARIAKAKASEFAPLIAENAIQYHGGAGFTWDFGLHFALRRIRRLSLTFGSADHHYRRIGQAFLAGARDDRRATQGA